MALPLTETDKFLLLSAVGAPETRDRISALLDLAGTGNMTGPASATDNALVRFDGSTGALVQNSGALLDDSNNLSGLAALSAVSANLSGLTASRALQTDASKNLQSSSITTTELGFLSGVGSSVRGISDTATLTNKTLTNPTINAAALSGILSGDHTNSGIVTFSNTTASSSTATGAVIISGGLGVGGAVNVGGIATFSSRGYFGGTSGLGADTGFGIGRGMGAVLTGTTQWGMFNNPTFVGSVATSGFRLYDGQARTDGTGTTIGSVAVHSASAASFSTNTVTRYAIFAGPQPTEGSNNAFLTDALTSFSSGNWFINQSGSAASRLGGALTVDGQLIGNGTSTNDSASASQIGELLTIVNTTDNSLTNGNVFSLGSVSITAGDWDVWGVASFSGSGSTSTFTVAGIGTTNTTLGTNGNGTKGQINQNLASQDSNFTVGPFRLSLSTPTTYYFNIRCDFSAGTVTGKGTLFARRRR